MKVILDDLQQRYSEMTAEVRCECEFATELVGGMPADEKALRAFVEHHLGIVDQAVAEHTVQRLLKQEVGERDVTPELGDINEKQVYGVNIIRRSDHGPWLGSWMVGANLKQAASGLRIFEDTKGVKKYFSECSQILPDGPSLVEPNFKERIYLLDKSGNPAGTFFKEIMGSVQTPAGRKSIMTHAECAPPGTKFYFIWRFIPWGTKEQDILDVLSMSMICGLGSAKALGSGRFKILQADITMKPNRDIFAIRRENKKLEKEQAKEQAKVA